ncbi:hypothetical protein [Streptomyces sp. NPDC050585]
MAQTFASLAAAARMERLDWRMRVLGDQLGDVKKAMDGFRRKLPER